MLKQRAAAVAITVLLALSTCWEPAHAAFGGFVFVPSGVANPLKYYPVCPRGRAGESCQCRVAGSEEANRVCSPGEYCDTRSGTCGPAAAPGRTRSR